MKYELIVPSLPISHRARTLLALPEKHYDENGRLIVASPREARELALLFSQKFHGSTPSAADLYGAAHIITAWDLVLDDFARGSDPYEKAALSSIDQAKTKHKRDKILSDVAKSFPNPPIWKGQTTPSERLEIPRNGFSGRESVMREWTLAALSNGDPAFNPFSALFSEDDVWMNSRVRRAWDAVEAADPLRSPQEPEDAPPLAFLRKPIEAAPNSVKDQLSYILTRWATRLGKWAAKMLGALDMIEEETRPRFGGPGPARRPGIGDLDGDARFSHDDDWMPHVVLIAKNILVWLHQLSQKYNRTIHRLDEIPDEELHILAERGFNALWLIGLWERSLASREIKRRMGNPEAAASAYSLFGYDIAAELGGWDALDQLRGRALTYGIRLASDMVPNHVGIDSDWVRNHPERLLSASQCPFPSYSFNGENLSEDGSVDIRLEDHYWNHSDAAVVFKRTDNGSGETRYVYHGNDGTTMPWNDTAQIDFLNPEAKEAVIQDILHVAHHFPLIRFDAAMVLARKHIRRLWYPAPGAGGAIPSRSEYALSDDDFDNALPEEFWRQVVDRVAAEIPGTLLLAEAFWMMEGYFVRALGMHRVYNSAFMNMLRDQKNEEYRASIKEVLAFEPGILQRYVNFMNNPDEETAVEQFGKDDRYFAVCTLLATLPGLPMFGHGQVEGLSEKYGMEYVRAYREEATDELLLERHRNEIFPILSRRHLFAGSRAFRLFDLRNGGSVNENVFVYSNSNDGNHALIVVNNAYERAQGVIHQAAPVKTGDGKSVQGDLAEALGLSGSPNDWLLMRDLVSGLWFIRAISDIQSNGLSLLVDGFGRQVFLDFRSVRESSDGAWGKLAAELGGAGTANPDDALLEIRLRPFRRALEKLLPEGSLEAMSLQLREGHIPRLPGSNEEILEALAALAESHRMQSGINETSAMGAQSPKIVLANIEAKLAASSLNWRFCGRRIRRRLKRGFGTPEFDEALFLAAWSVISPLNQLVGGQSPREVWNLWGIGRWFSENLPEITLRIALSRIGWAATLAQKRKLSEDELSFILSDSEVREMLGINEWDGVLWYSREGWQNAVRSLVLSAAADAGSGRSRRRIRFGLMRKLRVWRKRNALSDYHVDRLLASSR